MDREAENTKPTIHWPDGSPQYVAEFTRTTPEELEMGSGENFKRLTKKNWLSIKRKRKCLFSRRNGHKGKLIWGYSICLRLFGKTIL